jgi:hypothetical protein
VDNNINQRVVNWAQQNLRQPLEVKLKEHKVLIGICFAILVLIFGGLALIFFAVAVSSLRTNGWSPDVTKGVVGGLFFLAVLAVFCGGLLLLGKLTRKKFVKTISADGVRTRGGQNYRWEDLRFLDYKKVNTQVNRQQLAVSATRAAIMAGVEKVTVELVFVNGKAVVPPLVRNQAEILALLNTIPAERRNDGTATNTAAAVPIFGNQ